MSSSLPAGEIKSLTGLRGVAACYVLIYHALYHTDLPGIIGILARRGYLSVDLFFVLSGFVLGLNHGKAFATSFRWATYIAFWKKRVARIYPLYFAVSLAMVRPAAIGIIFPVSNLLLIQSWMLAPSFNGAAWSISTEWFAYLLFPVLTRLSLGRSNRAALLWAAISLAALALLATLPPTLLHNTAGIGPLDLGAWQSPAPLIRCIAEFSLGLITFRVARLAGLPGPRWAGQWQLGLTAAIVVLGMVPQSDILIVALIPILVWSLASDRGPVATVLASRPLHELGVLSYSIYLLHPLFIPLNDLATSQIPNAPLAARAAIGAAAVLLPTIAVAVMTYHVIERGGRRLVNRVLAWLPGQALHTPV